MLIQHSLSLNFLLLPSHALEILGAFLGQWDILQRKENGADLIPVNKC